MAGKNAAREPDRDGTHPGLQAMCPFSSMPAPLPSGEAGAQALRRSQRPIQRDPVTSLGRAPQPQIMVLSDTGLEPLAFSLLYPLSMLGAES